MTYDPLTKRSRLLFHWRAADLDLEPITGQTDTFARNASATGLTDSAAGAYTANKNQPAWQSTSSQPGLKMGANDALYWTFSAAPQTMTVYVKFVERGTVGGASDGLVHIGSATAASDPRFVVDSTGTYYRVTHDNGTVTPSATLATAPTTSQPVEIRAVLNSNGTVIIGQSVSGGTETTASSGTTGTLGASWAGARLYINSTGSTNPGTNEFRIVKVAPGVKSMASMRTLF